MKARVLFARAEKRAAELPDAQAVIDLNIVLDDPEIAAVVVCTETNRHEEVVLPAAAMKKHLFVEKPLGFAAAVLFSFGVYKARVTIGNPMRSGAELAAIGVASALAGYAVGAVFR